jgi:hypothetical protein
VPFNPMGEGTTQTVAVAFVLAPTASRTRSSTLCRPRVSNRAVAVGPDGTSPPGNVQL